MRGGVGQDTCSFRMETGRLASTASAMYALCGGVHRAPRANAGALYALCAGAHRVPALLPLCSHSAYNLPPLQVRELERRNAEEAQRKEAIAAAAAEKAQVESEKTARSK